MSENRNIEHLRFLSEFYMNLIECHQIQMSISEREFSMDRKNVKAYQKWNENKEKICGLYESWLRELIACQLTSFDDISKTMYYMMTSDCYWFLAKMNRTPMMSPLSNYSQACEAIENLFKILNDCLEPTNQFYQHVLDKYQRLVQDYKSSLGESVLNGRSTYIPSGMNNWDIYKCREALKNLDTIKSRRDRSNSDPTTRKTSAQTALCNQIQQLSRIILNTLV